MSVMTGFDIGSEFRMVQGEIGESADYYQAVVYSVIATMFMHRWAAGKYARYKKEFDPKVFPGKRWKWFPPFS